MPNGVSFVRAALAVFFLLGGTGAASAADVAGRVTIVDREGHPKPDSSGVVVFLDDLDIPPAVPSQLPVQSLRQVNKRFVPGVLPIVVGTTVEFPNDDIVHHNVFSLSRTKPFDLGIYSQGSSRSVRFDRTGLVKVYCNIHSQMVASIVVLANTHFVITRPDGTFSIEGVPLGGATIRTWYPYAAANPERKVKVTDTGVLDVDFRVIEDLELEIREDSLTVGHKNKWGKDYPSKY